MATNITRTYRVRGMDCTSCAENLERGIGKLSGVDGVRIDFMAEKIHIDGAATLGDINQRAQSLGHYEIIDEVTAPTSQTGDRTGLFSGGVMGFVGYLLRERPTQLALIGGTLILLTVIAALLGLNSTVANVLYVIAMSIAAYPIAKSGLINLAVNRNFNLNLLMTIAAVGAVVIGEMLEAAVVIFLFAIGEAMEGFTADRARESIRSLADLTPPQANRLHDDHTDVVPIEELQVGDHILVKPGERIPMDGIIIRGTSGVNQAPITGESVPVSKSADDTVYAGTINGDGALTVTVTAIAADNTLNRIIKLVEEAQSSRAPSQRRIDKFANWYTPSMAFVALLVAIIPPLVFGAPFFDPASGGHGWLYRALALLMIACPCALVISTPVTVVSAITTAARHGVLIKGGLHLENLGRIRAIAFDKTGTLTTGKPVVTSYHGVNCDPNCPDCDNMIAVAAAVEQQSTHPLAQAVVHAADSLENRYTAQSVSNLSGRGVQGQVNGQTVTIGSHRLFDDQFPHDKSLCETLTGYEQAGKTAMLVAQDDTVTGVILVADTPRDDSQHVISELKSLGLKTIMLTGDNATVAHVIAGQVGVDEVRAGLMPADKTTAVQNLAAQYGQVAMIGDGVNDTPALAAATVGIAMGGAGSAQAIETADIALMADDLRQLPFTLRLSQFAANLITWNIALSLGIKLVFTVLAIAGMTTLWFAILADTGLLILVTLNGMRPLRFAQSQ